MTSKQAFARFKNTLLEHSIQRPPYSVGVFSLKDVNLVVDFVTDSYFRHFKLFRYAFTPKQVLAFQTMPSFVETAMMPPPLSEGVAHPDVVEEEEDAVPMENDEGGAEAVADTEDEEDDTDTGRRIRALSKGLKAKVDGKHKALEGKIAELEARLSELGQ